MKKSLIASTRSQETGVGILTVLRDLVRSSKAPNHNPIDASTAGRERSISRPPIPSAEPYRILPKK